MVEERERVKVLMPTSARMAEQVEPPRQRLAEMVKEGPPLRDLLRLLARPIQWSERSQKLGDEIQRLQGGEEGLIQKVGEVSGRIEALQGEAEVEALRAYLALGRGSGYSEALGRLRKAEGEELRVSLALKACQSRLAILPVHLKTSMSHDLGQALQAERDEAERFRSEFLRTFATPEAEYQTPSSAAKAWSDIQMKISQVGSWRNRVTHLPERAPTMPVLIRGSDIEEFERAGRDEAAELLRIWGREISAPQGRREA